MNAAQTAANSLGKRIVVFTATLQHCADELVGHLCEAWPELEASVKCIDVALFVLERAISEMRGQPCKAATIIFAGADARGRHRVHRAAAGPGVWMIGLFTKGGWPWELMFRLLVPELARVIGG